MLIDYEYGMWNPEMYDIANYLNEFCCENAYPLGTGVAYPLANWPTEAEIVNISKLYYELGKGGVVADDDPELLQKVREVK